MLQVDKILPGTLGQSGIAPWFLLFADVWLAVDIGQTSHSVAV